LSTLEEFIFLGFNVSKDLQCVIVNAAASKNTESLMCI